MSRCTHLRRSVKGDDALVNDERLREILPGYRVRYPDSKQTDEQILDLMRNVLMAIPRQCSVCVGGKE